MCLQLKKSLYGLATAPCLWYEHLTSTLINMGFQRSAINPCLFYKKDMLLICYVDDARISSASEEAIDKVIQELRDHGFELTKEGSFNEYLGIKFEHNKQDNTFTLTQTSLINKIIMATGLEDCKPNWMPTSQVTLGSDPNGPDITEAWSYPSIIGMLLYLCTNTHPNISFAVSQVAHFNSAPKQSHAKAIKMIVRCLS